MKLPALNWALAALLLSVPCWAEGPSYEETYRPQYHFSPQKNWMNDPNGLVYFQGEYHLFYQYNPFGDTWGHMSWGHAVSKDLVHWEHLPVALPEKPNRMAFSGCVVVDENNTAGFQTGKEPALVAVYTGYRQSDGWQAQYIAYSNDRGRTWTDYSEEPVLDIDSTDFRDPNVFRYQNRWVMVVALPTERKVSFYASDDLKSWEKLSDFGPQGAVGGAWECPDFFPLPVENMPGEERWVLEVDLDRNSFAGGSGGQYFVGNFDGSHFTVDSPARPTPHKNGHSVAAEWNITGSGIAMKNDILSTTRLGKGTARSEQFSLDDDWLNFRIRGGRHPGELTLKLMVEGESVAETTGFNGDEFQWVAWDVSQWLGRKAHLELHDNTDKLWGYVDLTGFELNTEPAPLTVDLGRYVDYGPDYYACISFHNHPSPRIWLAWMNNWLYAQEIPTEPWRSAMSVPREVTLKRLGEAVELCQKPVQSLRKLRNEPLFTQWTWKGAHSTPLPPQGEIELVFEPGQSSSLDLSLPGLQYQFDLHNRVLRFTRHEADFHEDFEVSSVIPLRHAGDPMKITILYDRSSVELFTAEGTVCHTARVFPEEEEWLLFANPGDGRLDTTVWPWESSWKNR